MKISFLILLACFLTIVSSQVSTDPLALITDKLPQISLGRLVAPGDESVANVCQGQWTQEGYVCNKEKAIKYANDDTAQIKQIPVIMKGSLKLAEAISKQILKNTIKNLNLNESERIIITDFASPDRIEAKILKAQVCMDKLAQIRSSSLCATCSGHNYKYFFNLRGLLPEETCKEYTAICAPHFKDIVDIQSILLILVKTDTALASGLIKIINSIFTAQFKMFLNLIKEFTIMMHDMISLPTEAERVKVSIDLCQLMVKLNRKVFLATTLSLINIFATTLSVKVIAAQIRQTTIGTISNWFRNKRVLLFESGQFDFLANIDKDEKPDVSTLKNNNIYESFPGAAGTTTEIENGIYRPMNMSLIFP